MCIAVSGEVLSIDGDTAKVDIRGNTANINVGLVSPNVGDFVLVHAGCALQIIPKHEASSLDELFDEIMEAANGGT